MGLSRIPAKQQAPFLWRLGKSQRGGLAPDDANATDDDEHRLLKETLSTRETRRAVPFEFTMAKLYC